MAYVADTRKRCEIAMTAANLIAAEAKRKLVGRGMRAVLHVRLGEPERAREIVRQFEQEAANENALFYWLALTYCALGELDSAIEWLEKAEQAGAGILIIIAVEPSFAPLRPLPRFQALLRKLGLA